MGLNFSSKKGHHGSDCKPTVNTELKIQTTDERED
jgi:hypothetical protein